MVSVWTRKETSTLLKWTAGAYRNSDPGRERIPRISWVSRCMLLGDDGNEPPRHRDTKAQRRAHTRILERASLCLCVSVSWWFITVISMQNTPAYPRDTRDSLPAVV